MPTVPFANGVSVEAVFQPASGDPRDVAVNTFWFGCTAPTEAEATAFRDLVSNFYLVDDGTNPSVITFLANSLDRDSSVGMSLTARWYEGGALNAVRLDEGMGTATVSPTDIPQEVAVCLSFRAVASTVHPGRHRGRVFIGPLNAAAMDSFAGGPRVSASLSASLASAATTLHDQAHLVNEAKDTTWAIYSRADGAFYPVVNGYIDNAFDTLRHRGVRASLRTPWG